MFDRENFEAPPDSNDKWLSSAELALIDFPDESAATLPDDLSALVPGPFLAALLSVVSPAELSGYNRVLMLQAHQKLVSHFEAAVLEDVVSIADVMIDEFGDDFTEANEATALEIRGALRLTRRGAEVKIVLADDVLRRLPAVGASMAAGRLDVPRARILTSGTAHLDDNQAREVVDEVIDHAPRLTTGQLSAKVRRLCMSVDPEAAEERYAMALAQRRVVREATTDGTANLMILDAAPNRIGEAFNRINYIAKSLHRNGDARTLDQVRSDVVLDLLTGRSDFRKTGRGAVTLDVDLATLARLENEPGDLAGFGPVVADISRQVTEQQQSSEWRFRVVNPETGRVVHSGTTRRRPTADQQRYVEMRDSTCVFLGCRMPATECDLDHIDPWAETGTTNVDSLAPTCRHDHVGKDRFGWSYRPTRNGDYVWVSRLGHIYTTSGIPPPDEG